MCVTLFGKNKIDCKYFKERFYLQFCLKVMDEKVVGFVQCFQVFFKSVTEKGMHVYQFCVQREDTSNLPKHLLEYDRFYFII